MPQREEDVRRIVTGARARGMGDDQIRALVARYDERQQGTPPPAAASAGMLPQSTTEGDPAVPRAFGRPLTSDAAAMLEGADVMGRPMPPPGVLTGARAAYTAGKTGLGKVLGVATGIAAPAIKYEATKSVLQAAGVPAPIATAAGIAVSGYKRGAKQPTVTPKTSASASVPAASTPATPAPQVAPVASGSAPVSPAAPQWSPQRLRNEMGLAARRQKTTLTEQEYAVAEGMVKQGASPADAVKTVAQVAKPTPTAAVPKPKLSAAETKEYVRLRTAGKSNQDAMEALRQQREFVQKFGTPSSETVRAKVADRNATGRWQ